MYIFEFCLLFPNKRDSKYGELLVLPVWLIILGVIYMALCFLFLSVLRFNLYLLI